jgi:hypothetical protein
MDPDAWQEEHCILAHRPLLGQGFAQAFSGAVMLRGSSAAFSSASRTG